jgi:hypothetical protein
LATRFRTPVLERPARLTGPVGTIADCLRDFDLDVFSSLFNQVKPSLMIRRIPGQHGDSSDELAFRVDISAAPLDTKQ